MKEVENMNGYELIMKIQQKMQDPVFSKKFNEMVQELNQIPGLQQEVMRIAQMQNEKKRNKAIEKLPERSKKAVSEILSLLND